MKNVCFLDGSSKHHEKDVEFKGGSDITKGGDISVIDFPAGFRRACGPPARVQGSLVYRDGEPIGETDRRYYILCLIVISDTIGGFSCPCGKYEFIIMLSAKYACQLVILPTIVS
jgi:hypothetical protein